MQMATSDHLIRRAAASAPQSLRILWERAVRPAVGFTDPLDVLKDPHLTVSDKRAILASWASDASAVPDDPRLRWLLGTPEPVRLAEVLDALARLDRWTQDGGDPPPDGPRQQAADSAAAGRRPQAGGR